MHTQLTMSALQKVEQRLSSLPIIAILRGMTPIQSIEVAQKLLDAGIYNLEVPLNSPQPCQSIERIKNKFGDDIVIGAGTVCLKQDVIDVTNAGADLMLAPNTDSDVIKLGIENQLLVMPGIATPTEAFTAINAGATHLKVFPAQTLGNTFIKALKAVLPEHIKLYAVGGVSIAEMPNWLAAGADGVGIGSVLFNASDSQQGFDRKLEKLSKVVAQLHNNNTA
ncbi:2-dehydro-3-deoxy-6-phosphogalactonate aldolase [Aliiglaciecola sp.]|nr:2-dehydro-3-deoxy-6-phosphogalactonate aldolase [Aliiglaciecola sp.]